MRPRLKGTIRQKLMLFAVLLCVAMMGLVWLLNVQLLEPIYNFSIQKDLQATADTYAQVISQYGVIEDETGNASADFYQVINNVSGGESLLEGKCFEVANASGVVLLNSHRLGRNCLLHPAQPTLFGDRGEPTWNTRYMVALRLMVLKDGNTRFTMDEAGKTQMVVCRNVDNRYTVIVSTDLERIGQAAGVIGTQMPLIAALVLALGLAGAWWFSRWFTKPICALSNAARSIAGGDYTVRVEPQTDDEIGMLAQDFNIMAIEVGRTSQLQRDLIANISHDLRTPLTLIKGYAETVRDLTGDDKTRRNEQLAVIVDETDRLSGLVNSVMELSKYSSGTEKLNLVEFDLAQLCEEVACRYEMACEAAGAKLDIATDTQCNVTADPDMLSRVIHNFLANAMHHVGPDGWLRIRALPQADGTTRVEVSDHGAGIAQEDLPYIFDRYYRTRASAGKVGTGLGLSISKAILTSHGFAFGAESTLGEGSTFWFSTKRTEKGSKAAELPH